MKHKRSLISIAVATLMLVSLWATCASTSVSAAVGQPIAAGTGPSACILMGSNYMYLFVKGYDGALWYRVMSFTTMFWTGGWSSLGGKLSSSPCAVSWGAGRLDVYVTGTDGAVWERYTTDSGRTWSGWASLGGRLAPGTGPGASSWAAGRLDVFVQGTDHALWHKSYQNGWSGWQSLGGKLTSSPGAVSRQAGVITVYVRGTEGAVWEKWYAGGTWHGWANLGGVIYPGTGPAVSVLRSTINGQIIGDDLFIMGMNGALYTKTWAAASGWSGWANLGGSLTSSPTAVAQKYAVELYVRWSNGNVCQKEYYADADHVYRWHNWQCGMHGPPCQIGCG
jgi:hypothetical protein